MRVRWWMRQLSGLFLIFLYAACPASPTNLPVAGHSAALGLGSFRQISAADGIRAITVSGPARIFVVQNHQTIATALAAPEAAFPLDVPISIADDGTRNPIFVVVLPASVDTAQELTGQCFEHDSRPICTLCMACMMGCCLPPPRVPPRDAGIDALGTPMPGTP